MRALAPRIACAVAALTLAACRESGGPEPPEQFSYAIFNADVAADESGDLTTDPVGYFFRAPALSLPNSASQLEGCILQQLVSPGSNLPAFIGAGDSVAFAPQGGPTVYLKPATDTGVTAYRVPGATPEPVPVTAGAVVTFTVPGETNGFPSSTISIKTAEPYEMSPVPDDLAAGESVTLTWTPAGTDDSRMDIAFMYATAQNGNLSDQLFCSLADDGEFTVRAADLNGFRVAAGGVRRFTSRRWRSSFKDMGESVMLVLSSFLAPAQEWP